MGSPKTVGAVTEDFVGIQIYLNQHKGFKGIIKQRYSDFLVWELHKTGELVHLTDLTCPKNVEQKEEIDEDILDASVQEQMKQLTASEIDEVLINTDNRSKDERKRIHEMIKSNYTKVNANTEQRGENKYIVIKRSSNKKGQKGEWGRVDNRQKWPWPGDYVHFTLYKENLDTMEAINKICRQTWLGNSSFTYAGVKDKRAKTSQRICVKKVEPQKLLGAVKHNDWMQVGNIEFQPHSLNLGDSQGNHFAIVLREVDGNADDINTALGNLQKDGFVNYFGMQRFGTTTIPTHHVGLQMLHNQWDKAVDLILSPRVDGSAGDLAEMRQCWSETHDAQLALSKGKKYSSVERSLLEQLNTHKNNYHNAIYGISRNMRMMYVHAYQSYIWNHAASQRIRKYGKKPVPGDLVLDADGKPRVLTADDCGDVSIYDVVLPLPGYDVNLPENDVKDIYTDILSKDDLTLEHFKQKAKSFCLNGNYRLLLNMPKKMSWKITKYSDNTVPLCSSDMDIINKATLPDITDVGSHTAVVVEFSLPSCTYATMALREAIKHDTSARAMGDLQQTKPTPHQSKLSTQQTKTKALSALIASHLSSQREEGVLDEVLPREEEISNGGETKHGDSSGDMQEDTSEPVSRQGIKRKQTQDEECIKKEKVDDGNETPTPKKKKRKSGVNPTYSEEDLTKEYSVGFVDTHCHLDFIYETLRFKGSFSEFRNSEVRKFPPSFEACVTIFCNPATFSDSDLWNDILRDESVYAAFGCHPKNADEYTDETEKQLKICLDHKRVVALGEIGLDYSPGNESCTEKQKTIFAAQLKISLERDLPLVIHSRDASDDCLTIMKEVLPNDKVIHRHCFTGDYAEACVWMAAFPNLYLGFTPLVTYTSATDVHEAATKVPLNRLLLETDAPYFVPAMVDRKKVKCSYPGLALHTAAQIAAFKKITLEELLVQVRQNTRDIYKV